MKSTLLVKSSLLVSLAISGCSTEEEDLTIDPAIADGTYTRSQIVCADDVQLPLDATWAVGAQAIISELPDPTDSSAVQAATQEITGKMAALNFLVGEINELDGVEYTFSGNSLTETTMANDCTLQVSRSVKLNLDNAIVWNKGAIHSWSTDQCSFNVSLNDQTHVPSTALKTSYFVDSSSTDAFFPFEVSKTADNVYTLTSSNDPQVIAAVKENLGDFCEGRIKFTLTKK